MLCNHECYKIGGPWIEEDPSCPIHGVNRKQINDSDESKREILYRLWCREINADEAFDMLEYI